MILNVPFDLYSFLFFSLFLWMDFFLSFYFHSQPSRSKADLHRAQVDIAWLKTTIRLIRFLPIISLEFLFSIIWISFCVNSRMTKHLPYYAGEWKDENIIRSQWKIAANGLGSNNMSYLPHRNEEKHKKWVNTLTDTYELLLPKKLTYQNNLQWLHRKWFHHVH